MGRQKQHGQVFVRRFEVDMNRFLTFVLMTILTVFLYACGGGGSAINSIVDNSSSVLIALKNSTAGSTTGAISASSAGD